MDVSIASISSIQNFRFFQTLDIGLFSFNNFPGGKCSGLYDGDILND